MTRVLDPREPRRGAFTSEDLAAFNRREDAKDRRRKTVWTVFKIALVTILVLYFLLKPVWHRLFGVIA